MSWVKILFEYKKAQKFAKRNYFYNISQGKNGYLPSLEGILNNTEIISEIKLGTVEIPLNRVIGTYSHNRSLSFAHNFMPLHKAQTEFARKWCFLYLTQINEGIRDAITVYEYLNWFYVMEGHKRVCILKYLKTPSHYASIIRLMPRWDNNNQEIRLYYKFLEFNKKTGLFSLWFSRENSYQELINFFDSDLFKNSNQSSNPYKWFEDSIYYNFEKIVKQLPIKKSHSTASDLLLVYINKFGIPERGSARIIKQNLKIILKAKTTAQSLNLNQTRRELFKPKILNAAFIYPYPIESSSWLKAHEIGRKFIDDQYPKMIKTSSIDNVDFYDDTLINEIAGRNDMIFFSTLGYNQILSKLVPLYSDVHFFICCSDSLKQFHKNLSRYFGKMYEVRFLTGVIAGAMTQNNKIGYLMALKIPGYIRGLNAFALGVKTVNPHAKIILKCTHNWYDPDLEEESTFSLIKNGIDIMTIHCDSYIPYEIARQKKIFFIGHNIEYTGNDEHYLCSNVWNWGKYYEKVVLNYGNGSWNFLIDLFNAAPRLENTLWGLDADIVDISPMSDIIPPHVQNLVKSLKKMIINKDLHPFGGASIYDQNNNLRISDKEIPNIHSILNMDWLTDNIIEQ